MGFDLVIRGGRVVDGTGMPGYTADVGVRDGRVAGIGRLAGDARRVIDADGLVVAPGFIDVHTHYDVQLDWDPTASPSCWHGVTTVLTGNCGFTLAPARPEDVGWLAAMLSRVEGMSKEALAAGFRFAGGGFGDFWRRHEGKLGVNAGGYVGHSAVRRYVMGDAASERRATPDEIDAMRELVRQAMREGALGFSTSQLDIHVDDQGREVPSNHAAPEEIVALCGVLAEFGRGTIECIPRSFASGYNEADRKLLLEMYRASGRPIELNLLAPSAADPMNWQRTLEFVREAAADGARLHPQFMTNRPTLYLKLADTFIFDEIPAWRDVLTRREPERSRLLRDPDVRQRLRETLADRSTRAVGIDVADLEVDAVRVPEHEGRVGRTVRALAREAGLDPLDCFLDLSLEEDLQTTFRTRPAEAGQQFLNRVTEAGIREPTVMAGSSDGGAHLASFVGADYTTRLLKDWVPDVLTLEQAVWRLTGMPATVHGIEDRGFLRAGAKADLVLFDPARLDVTKAYLVRDFPAEAERYVIGASGYVRTLVNGEVLLEEGRHTGALPGEFVRG